MKKSLAAAAIALLLIFNIYNLISTGSRIFKSDLIWSEIAEKKSTVLKELIASVDKSEPQFWIAGMAPVIWWHPQENHKATDPQEILPSATLWYREINRYFPFIDNELKELGPFNPAEFRNINYNGSTPADDVTRLMETGGIHAGYAGFEIRYDSFMKPSLPAPMFWRISRHPLFKDVQLDDEHHVYMPVEYWYHFNYNDTRWHFGNHDGDWESFLVVFEVREKEGTTSIRPLALSVSAHGGSSWHCELKLSHTKDGRIELFNALGTHATYAEPGNHWRLIYPDKTERGEAWETWHLMRPVEKENFYGFSGSWGRTSYVYFQNAPIPPGPHFKYLPADANIERAASEFKKVISECSN
jgi:hypothetical protein